MPNWGSPLPSSLAGSRHPALRSGYARHPPLAFDSGLVGNLAINASLGSEPFSRRPGRPPDPRPRFARPLRWSGRCVKGGFDGRGAFCKCLFHWDRAVAVEAGVACPFAAVVFNGALQVFDVKVGQGVCAKKVLCLVNGTMAGD